MENNTQQVVRKAYETPLLWADLRTKIIQAIQNSGLMECEVEAILKDIYMQVREQSDYALTLAKQMKEKEQEEVSE